MEESQCDLVKHESSAGLVDGHITSAETPSHGDMADDSVSASPQEQVTTFTDKEEFLNVIHIDFLRVVQPVESGLLDIFRSRDIVSSDEENDIGGEKTRRDKARKLWNILHRVPSKKFAEDVMPALKEIYPHIVQQREFCLPLISSEGNCMRHRIMERMSLKRFADILPSLKCCTPADYSKFVETTSPGEEDWDNIFSLFQKNGCSGETSEALTKMLLDKQIQAPADIQQLIQGGFKCSCKAIPPEYLPKFDLLDLKTLKLGDEGSSGTYPSSPLSDYEESHVDSGVGYILGSSSSEESELFEQVDLEQFEKLAQKFQFKAINNKLNEGRVHAAGIRTLLRFLEGSRDETRNMARKAKDESLTVNKASVAEMERHRNRAMKAQRDIEHLYERIHKTIQDMSDLDKCFDFELLPNQRRCLLQIKHMLESDFVEAQHFANTSKELLKEITQYCSAVPAGQRF